jgi:hypothetical protein
VNSDWWPKIVALIDSIWPGPTGRTIHDDLLGELTHRAHGWCGRIDVGQRPLDIVLGGRSNELAPDQVAAARHILTNLDAFEAEGRRFLESEALRSNLPKADALCGFGARGVSPRWRRADNMKLPSERRLVNTTALGRLQFTIANDGNVLEVYFDGDDPIDTDYH